VNGHSFLGVVVSFYCRKSIACVAGVHPTTMVLGPNNSVLYLLLPVFSTAQCESVLRVSHH
jgi:hypothetical protein